MLVLPIVFMGVHKELLQLGCATNLELFGPAE